jgi:hypothetical protein
MFHVYPCCSCKILLSSNFLTFVVVGVCFLNATFAIFEVVLKLARVDVTVYVEVLPVSVLFVLVPVTNVELALHIVVLPLSMFHPLEKVTLVTLVVRITHFSTTVWSTLEDLSVINSSVGKFHAMHDLDLLLSLDNLSHYCN